MIDLSVKFGKIELKNPVMVGASELTWSANLIKKMTDAGAGAIVTKTQHLSSGYYKPDKYDKPLRDRRRRRYMFMNVNREFDKRLLDKGAYFTMVTTTVGSSMRSQDIVPQVEKAKKMVDVPIITSIAGVELNEYETMARMNAEAGADAIEVLDPCHYAVLEGSYSFPNFTQLEAMKLVKKTVDLPVIAKCAFAWENAEKTMKDLEEAGADMVTAIGEMSLQGLEIDVETGKPVFDTHLCCYGSWFKPISLSWITRAAQASKIPISGVSGIVRWDHAVEYIMAGATTVQVASIIYIKGPKVIGDIVNGIRRFMERKGYNKLEDFRGISLDKILSKEKLRAKYVPMVASVDIDKCTGCGICIDQCLCDALSLKEGTAEVDKERCMGCEICVQICPVKAISLRV